jgi:hypothetical protein
MSKADLTRTLEVASGKSAYKLVIQGLFEVLALQAPTKIRAGRQPQDR